MGFFFFLGIFAQFQPFLTILLRGRDPPTQQTLNCDSSSPVKRSFSAVRVFQHFIQTPCHEHQIQLFLAGVAQHVVRVCGLSCCSALLPTNRAPLLYGSVSPSHLDGVFAERLHRICLCLPSPFGARSMRTPQVGLCWNSWAVFDGNFRLLFASEDTPVLVELLVYCTARTFVAR